MVFWCGQSIFAHLVPWHIFWLTSCSLLWALTCLIWYLQRTQKFSVASCSVSVLCVSIFSFILSARILEKSVTTLVMRVSIDLKSAALSLTNWIFLKKCEISEFICLWLSILGSNEFNSFYVFLHEMSLRVHCLYCLWKPVFFKQ